MMNTGAEPRILSFYTIRLTAESRTLPLRFRATSPFELRTFSNTPSTAYDAPNNDNTCICLMMRTSTAGRRE